MRTVLVFFLFNFTIIYLQKIQKLEVKYVDLEIETPVKINCSNFEEYFGEELKSVVITNTDKINEFLKILKTLKEDKNNYMPDVRVKIVLFFPNKAKTICLSELGVVIDNKPYVISESLIDYIYDVKEKYK